MLSHIREDLRLSGKYGPLSGPMDPGGTFLVTSKVVGSALGGVTRGPIRMMPCVQTREGTRAKMLGRKPPCHKTCLLCQNALILQNFFPLIGLI